MRRISYAGRGLVASLEEEQLAAEIAATELEPEVPETIGDNADSLETELIDLTDDQAAMQEIEGEAEEAVETEQALESMRIVLEGAVANGGMDRNGAHALGIALEHMYKRVGLNKHVKTKQMPALESFGGTSSRIQATQWALEALSENAAKLWQHIVAIWEKIIGWAKDFFERIFVGAVRLRERADNLAKKAHASTGEANGQTIENDRLVQSLFIGNGVPSDLRPAVAEFHKVCDAVFSGGLDAVKWCSEIADSLEKNKDNGEFANQFTLMAVPASPILKEISGNEAAGFPATVEGLSLLRSEELFGGQAIVAYLPKAAITGEAAVKALGHMGAFKGDFHGSNKKAPTETKLPALTKENAFEVCRQVAEIAQKVDTYRKTVGASESVKKKMVNFAKQMSAKVAGADEGAAAKFAAMKSVLTATAPKVDEPGKSFGVYALNTGKALLDYVEESLKISGTPQLGDAKRGLPAPSEEPAFGSQPLMPKKPKAE
jgi:hypothetical protein